MFREKYYLRIVKVKIELIKTSLFYFCSQIFAAECGSVWLLLLANVAVCFFSYNYSAAQRLLANLTLIQINVQKYLLLLFKYVLHLKISETPLKKR